MFTPRLAKRLLEDVFEMSKMPRTREEQQEDVLDRADGTDPRGTHTESSSSSINLWRLLSMVREPGLRAGCT